MNLLKTTMLLMFALVAITHPAQAQLLKKMYPATKKVRQTDVYFGTKVADPYRWLEDDNSAETRDWVTAQNKVTFDYLSKIPFRDPIRKRLSEILNYPKYAAPMMVGDYLFFEKNDGLQNQNVKYVQKGLDGTPSVFLDPNTMSKDGTVAVSYAGVSTDKQYIAYTLQKAGSDWSEIYVKDIATGRQLPDKIEWVKFSGAAWYKNGFFYSRYDKPAAGKELSGTNSHQKVYYHKLGDSQDKDELVYENKNNPQLFFGTQVTEDERFLILSVSKGTDGTELHCRDLSLGQKDFRLLFEGFKYNYSVVDNVGDKLLVQTNDGASNQHVVLVDPAKPAKSNWKTIIPEKPEMIDAVSSAGGKLLVSYLKDATTRVYQFDMDGRQEREISFPTFGAAGGFGGYRTDKFVFYTFSSFTYPFGIYRYDIATGKSELWRRSEVAFKPEDFEAKQVFYTSKDGTRVPMFIVHKKGLKLNGKNPTLLYGYGGFNVNMLPSFSAANIVWLENGGVYAMPNLRGGSEYGEKWHEAGKLLKKQNVFDDFIAAAEYLIRNKYTSRSKLAISGGSNGGLLVGACMTQRPDLFRVALPAVGVMDMLRYHKFTIGWGWVVEYGCADSSRTDFQNLYRYSPLHNLKKGVNYPATLVTTADHDDRVVPAHSFKFAATLQEKTLGLRPALIRIETQAGHGAGKPISKLIDEVADKFAFAWYNMKYKPKY